MVILSGDSDAVFALYGEAGLLRKETLVKEEAEKESEKEKGGVLLYITSDTIHFWYGETVVEGMAISWHVVLYENRNCHHIPNKPICAKKFTILSTAEWLLIYKEY